MPPPVQTYGREDVLDMFTAGVRTDPDSLAWAPLLGFLGNTLRLRMNITEDTLSHEPPNRHCRPNTPRWRANEIPVRGTPRANSGTPTTP